MKLFKEMFTKEYWESNAPRYAESKFKLMGLILAILVCLFAYALLRMSDNRYQDRINDINNSSIERQRVILNKLDSAKWTNALLAEEVDHLNQSIKDDSIIQANSILNLNQSLNELKYYRNNEKVHIPNATFDKQLEFIRTVKHEELR